jgi:PAS domain S-box-containing protein
MARETTSSPPTPDAADAPAADERRRRDRRAAGSRSSQAMLRQIVERLADGIVIVGADGRIRFANPAAERLFGRSSAELIGQEFGYPLAATEPAEIEIIRRGTGVVVADLRVVDSIWDGEPATLVSLRDVTDRKQAEERERQLDRERAARAEAEAANQAKSEFLAVMSHELRTPLNAVLGYAELLDLGVAGSLTAEQRQQLGRITASGRHLLGLVNEILDFAKMEAGRLVVERTPVSVADAVDAAIVLAQPLAEARGLTLAVRPEIERSLQFIGDRERVLQILANLLSNAVKFTASGGDIHVEVAQTTHVASRHLHGSGPWIVIRVVDTGIGIPPEQQEAIFAPFVQGQGGHTRERDGTGLGLTISRRLARLMRGDLVVRSLAGQGSEFALLLPAADPAVERASSGDPAEGDALPLNLVPRTRGLAAVGDALLHETEAILDGFVAQMRRDPAMPGAGTLRSSQLMDHVGTMLADISSALITLDEADGAPSALLHDCADIQRLIADRHGLQRARLGWTVEALQRECTILHDEVHRAMHRCFHDPASAPQFEEAMAVIKRYLEQALETSRRALQRATRQARSPR